MYRFTPLFLSDHRPLVKWGLTLYNSSVNVGGNHRLLIWLFVAADAASSTYLCNWCTRSHLISVRPIFMGYFLHWQSTFVDQWSSIGEKQRIVFIYLHVWTNKTSKGLEYRIICVQLASFFTTHLSSLIRYCSKSTEIYAVKTGKTHKLTDRHVETIFGGHLSLDGGWKIKCIYLFI